MSLQRQNLRQNLPIFELKWLKYVEKLSPFSLFVLYASDNLVHILHQLGIFNAHYTHQKN